MSTSASRRGRRRNVARRQATQSGQRRGPAAPIGQPPAELAQLVRGGDLRGLRALVERTSTLGDELDAYRARRSLISGCFAATKAVPERQLPNAFAATAEVTLASLEADPSQPLFLNWAGVALYELWSLRAAERLFEAALALDPELAKARSNLEAVGGRRKRLAGGAEPTLHPALGGLRKRAERVAALAGPRRGMTVSLCMIVRDEQELIAEALRSVQGAVDELVVVDTGSRDRTAAIARELGAKVIEVPWEDSFAAARNRSLEAASCDWILYLDADERLVVEDRQALRALLAKTWREAFYLRERNLTGSRRNNTAYVNDALRLFRNRDRYRFEGRLHEQILHRLPADLPEKLERTAVRIDHLGYLQEIVAAKRKVGRNLQLLEREAAEGKESPFLHFNLGTTFMADGDAERALAEFGRAWELIEADPNGFRYPFTPALASSYVTVLAALGRHREAIAQAQRALDRYPDHVELVLRQARSHHQLGERDRALELARRCLELGEGDGSLASTAGAGGYLARTLIGVIQLERGELEGAAAELQLALEENPAYLDAVRPYATALLALGVGPELLDRELEAVIGKLTPPVRFMVATALFEHGQLQDAARAYEAVLAAEPQAVEAAIALAELRLAGGDLDGAARAAATVPPDAPQAPDAARLQLVAALLTEAELREAIAGAPLPEAELAVWRRLADPTTAMPLATESQQPLLALAARLLELRQFKRFEALLGMLPEVCPEDQQRHRLLAELFLEKGFYSSAAREWFALADAGRDPQALAGLATVALRTSFPEQARELARQALARDPACARAKAVLAALGVEA